MCQITTVLFLGSQIPVTTWQSKWPHISRCQLVQHSTSILNAPTFCIHIHQATPHKDIRLATSLNELFWSTSLPSSIIPRPAHALNHLNKSEFVRTRNKTHVLWEEGSTKRGTTQENLHLPWSLSAAFVSIRCSLEWRAVYSESCWCVKWNCRCTLTCT